MPCGSSSARSLRNSGRRGYICSSVAALDPGVLGQVDAAAVGDHELVELVEERAEAGGAGREVERQRPAGARERQQAGVGLAEALEHGHEGRGAVRATISNERRTAASAPNGITYWYWRKPPGP